MIPKIFLTPKVMADIHCPKCSKRDGTSVNKIKVYCSDCKRNFETDLHINVYMSVAKAIISSLAKHNEIWIQGEKQESDIILSDDLLKPKTLFEHEVWHTLLAIQFDHRQHKCWEVSEITTEIDDHYLTRCNECGVCHSCVQCTKCNHYYVPEEKRKEKIYVCPKCNNKKHRVSVVKLKDNNCPHCNSDKVSRTTFDSTKKQCPKCHTSNIMNPKRIPVYRLVIQWIDRYKFNG